MAVPARLRRMLVVFGYIAFYIASFLVFAYLTFPYDRLRDYIIARIEHPDGGRTAAAYQVSIIELSPYWLTGLELQGLRIQKHSDNPNEPPLDTTIPRLTARVSLLRLLIGRLSVAFDAEVPGGSVEGTYTTSFDGSDVAVDLTLDNVNLRRIGLVRAATSIPMKGMLSGTVELDLPEDHTHAEGVIELNIRNLELADGESRIPLPGVGSGLTIETIQAGNFELAIDVHDGLGHFRRFDAHGPDVQLQGTGDIHLEREMRLSRLDLLLRARFTDIYKNKSSRTQALFSLLEMNPILRSALTGDNWYQLRLRGSVGTRLVPTPAGHERWPAARR